MDPHAGNLKRTLGLFPLTNIVVANMIGAGIFTTTGLLIGDLGNPVLMLLLWLAGGLIALCGALSYGVLGAAMPYAGGEYVFLSRLYHPMVGFLSGWTSFVVGFSAPIAASAIGISEYLYRAFPEMFTWSSSVSLLEPLLFKKLLAVSMILFFTIVHMRGLELGARLQNVLTLLKIALILGLIVAGLAWGSGDFSHLTENLGFSLDFGTWKTIGLSLMWILFAYSGWNAATYIGSEVKNPTRILPLSLILGTVVVIMLYLALNIVFLYALSPDEMSGVISIGGLAMGSMFGRSMETAASALIAFALFSSLSAFIILGPRVYFAMAKDGNFFRSVASIHPRFKVPARSIGLQGAIASLLVLSGTFDQILTFMGFALSIFPLLAVFGVFILKRRDPLGNSGRTTVVAPVVYLGTGLLILILAYLERPVESTIALVTVAAGIPLYAFFKRQQQSQPS